ncbi:hypothetical protein B0T19DRAFT_457184 [Cercophora scortea]|uniref:PLL-like beta propeller domain-containing protein n=1 Tax=Cercophora scortea TaxID=314031 RepID=A0AAE0IWA4_9PEZI|nr:hypothetical protein B0T19DRAFT_457184 [Cercophora scortea]
MVRPSNLLGLLVHGSMAVALSARDMDSSNDAAAAATDATSDSANRADFGKPGGAGKPGHGSGLGGASRPPQDDDENPPSTTPLAGSDASPWANWLSLGGTAVTKPTVASWGTNRLDVFVTGTTSELYHWWSSVVGTWSSVESLGGELHSSPVAVSVGENYLDVFALGRDDDIAYTSWNGNSWSGFTSLSDGNGYAFQTAPLVVTSGYRLDVFGLGLDSIIQRRTRLTPFNSFSEEWEAINDPGTNFEALNGTVSFGSAVWSQGDLHLFAVGTAGSHSELYWNKFDGGDQGSWEELGGILLSQPAAVAWGNGYIDVFVVGTDYQLYDNRYDGSRWSDWFPLGGTLESTPVVVADPANTFKVYAVGTDSGVYLKEWNGSEFSDWQDLNGTAIWTPAAASYDIGKVEVFALDTSHSLRYTGSL